MGRDVEELLPRLALLATASLMMSGADFSSSFDLLDTFSSASSLVAASFTVRLSVGLPVAAKSVIILVGDG